VNFFAAEWLWLYAGVLLMLAELAAPGFVIFFFGLAAVTTGGILFLAPLSLTAQLALFAVFSVLYLLGLRRFVKSVFLGDAAERSTDEFAGRLARVVSAIRPGLPGRVLLGDAEWTAAAAVPLEPGADVRVVSQDNLTLNVEPVA